MGTDVRDGIGAMLDEYRQLASRFERLTAEMAAAPVTGRSADGCVTAAVGPLGELSQLSIDEEVAGSLDLASLAERVLEASARAAALARERRLTAVADLLPEHLRALVARAAGVPPTVPAAAPGAGRGGW
jgi:DNA-binding protein YbaB